ncbi:hypothetical protein K488DRAFT_90130 [Vararia minispora EC-137]|uniref:Uncharacterized protein n=1 Tax=Vararia minispora EC-137 TaxID=1314806 RepID=A0ACB8Q8F6_9AGAM|nr:hypothetical protein K488DRAFT_90130 [Vararia minispora EC-137]
MFAGHFIQLAALLASCALASPAPMLARATGPLFSTDYEEWTDTLPPVCDGSPNDTGTFYIGRCASFAQPAGFLKLTPHGLPSISNCSVTLWQESGCTGTSRSFDIPNGENSGCIVPFQFGFVLGAPPPPAVSVEVVCADN